MATNILAKYAALNAMEVKELLVEWNKYFDRPPSSHNNKTYLINQIIYRIQELTYGGLTRRTIDRLEALAESEVTKQCKSNPSRLAVGTRLVREVKGVEHHVQVLADGYEYQGMKYRSLSGVACRVNYQGNACHDNDRPALNRLWLDKTNNRFSAEPKANQDKGS